MEGDPTSFEEAMRSSHSSEWLDAMKDEMKSMSTNDVWDLEKNSQWNQNGRLQMGLQDEM